VTVSTDSDVHFDPYDVELIADPYPMFARLRDEAPLYYNAEYDFFALSRYADVNKALVDHGTYSSARGVILELIKANLEIPSGMLIFEDPPIHDVHRKLLSRMFTPRKINALEPMIRDFCAQLLDPLLGSGRFDFVTDLGAIMPMKVISTLLGIPEDDQEYIRIDWRADNPSDDIMTDLLNVEFVDETGTTRRLTRSEILVYINVVAGAGNETTTRLIGWAGKVLAEHPDQRRELVRNPGLIPQAIEELLRYEPPAPHMARYVTRDVTWYDQTVPEGSVMMTLLGSACRDERQFGPDAGRFDIHREPRPHLTFSVGTHFCLG
jgi:cytochrome P450